MSQILTESEKHERLRKIMGGFRTAMLVTHAAGEGLRSRPLAVAESEDDGRIYFGTSATSGKVSEIEVNPDVNISMQDDRRFVSITGKARLTRDRQLIDKLWSSTWKVWFPGGKDDPNLLLIEVDPVEAQYWDSGGLEGIKYLFQAAKALVMGAQPDSDRDERRNAKITM
jgi:general stress protein 26